MRFLYRELVFPRGRKLEVKWFVVWNLSDPSGLRIHPDDGVNEHSHQEVGQDGQTKGGASPKGWCTLRNPWALFPWEVTVPGWPNHSSLSMSPFLTTLSRMAWLSWQVSFHYPANFLSYYHNQTYYLIILVMIWSVFMPRNKLFEHNRYVCLFHALLDPQT